MKETFDYIFSNSGKFLTLLVVLYFFLSLLIRDWREK